MSMIIIVRNTSILLVLYIITDLTYVGCSSDSHWVVLMNLTDIVILLLKFNL